MKKIAMYLWMILFTSSLNAQPENVQLEMGKLYYGAEKITKSQYKFIIRRNPEAMDYFKKQRTAISFAYPMAFVGGLGIGYGAVGIAFNKNKNPDLTPVYTASLAGGIFLAVISFVLELEGTKSMKKSIRAYNENKKSFVLQLNSTQNEIGIVANF